MTQTTTTPAATGLHTKALTVNLNIRAWSARKHDKKLTKEVDDNHNAKDAGRYNKMLIAKEALANIMKKGNAARQYHYENTLPWEDEGARLLPSANYFTYTSEMSILKNDFETAVREFLSNYQYIIDEAKQRLNGLFNQEDYPSPLQIESKFGFRIEFMQVPDKADFRLDLSQTEVNNLTLSIENSMRDRINKAVSDTWERIKKQLEHMKETLHQQDKVFRDTLFSNLSDIIELMPKLNVTNDPNIAKVCEEMKKLLVSPDAVRTNSNLRAEKAQEVDRILNQFNSFFA